jgi:hypothetical protein
VLGYEKEAPKVREFLETRAFGEQVDLRKKTIKRHSNEHCALCNGKIQCLYASEPVVEELVRPHDSEGR